ncbi:nuclear transport factor 2 family protein [Microbacterium paludicola]|uniref:nuclear transport factor 2 family protein n=1 Tax=Microbacterium paludicola TaxID=300019 RepID=UPI0031D6DB7D
MATTNTSLAVAQQFIAAFENRDPDAVVATLREDATLTIRLHIDGSPAPWYEFDGADHIRGYITSVAAKFDSVSFLDQVWTVGHDGGAAFVETRGNILSSAEKLTYRNVYVFKFEIDGEKITAVTEYANPVTYANLGIEDSEAEAAAR